MTDPSVLLTIIGVVFTYTITVVGLVNWLNGKFRSLEKLLYHELEKHRREYDKQLNNIGIRLLRMEIAKTGITHTPASEISSVE